MQEDAARRSVHVTPLGDGQADEDAVTAIERASFSKQTFDLAEERTRPWARIWVARLGSATSPPVAFLLAWMVADELHVLSVATLPELRRRGIATALLGVVVAFAAEHQTRLVLLEVRRSNEAAIALYRAAGFSATAVRKAYYADNDEDAIEMVLMLDPSTGEVLKGHDAVLLEEI